MNLFTWFDEKTSRTKFRVICNRCGKKYHTCVTPQAAWRSAVKNGYDLETGLCKVCRVMDNMAVLKEKRAA